MFRTSWLRTIAVYLRALETTTLGGTGCSRWLFTADDTAFTGTDHPLCTRVCPAKCLICVVRMNVLQGTAGVGVQCPPEGRRRRVTGLHPRRSSTARDQGVRLPGEWTRGVSGLSRRAGACVACSSLLRGGMSALINTEYLSAVCLSVKCWSFFPADLSSDTTLSELGASKLCL